MQSYDFSKIKPVPQAIELVEAAITKANQSLSAQNDIDRIRLFYFGKTKTVLEIIKEAILEILDNFPIIDDLHAFYAALMNVLYDGEQYKAALLQVTSARVLLERSFEEYSKILKNAQSLQICKLLKKETLKKMCVILKVLAPHLQYLENIRQHMTRLPLISPFDRTLLIIGYPNVGKSSFLNKITNANVEIQPYPFTTKSLYVGYTQYQYLRWQVIDSPGILDHALENSNTIEKQTLVALTHIEACILFFLDISETSGYSIFDQMSLLRKIKARFNDKPFLTVLTKCDLEGYEDLCLEKRSALDDFAKQQHIKLIELSITLDDRINDLKSKACEALLQFRLEKKEFKNKRFDAKEDLKKEPNEQERKHLPLSKLFEEQKSNSSIEFGASEIIQPVKKQIFLSDVLEGMTSLELCDPELDAKFEDSDKLEEVLIDFDEKEFSTKRSEADENHFDAMSKEFKDLKI